MPAIQAAGLMLAHRAAAAAPLPLPIRRCEALTRMRGRGPIGHRLHGRQVLLDLGESILRNEGLRLILVVSRPFLEIALLGHKILSVANAYQRATDWHKKHPQVKAVTD